MFKDAIRNSLAKVGRGFFRLFFPPRRIPFASSESDLLFPGLY